MLQVLLLVGQLAVTRHWPPGARVPVWVDLSHAPAGASPLIDRALKNWSDASRGQLTLVRAATRADGAIRIVFLAGDGIYGEAAPRVDSATGFIARADIAINSAVPNDTLDAAIVVYLTALHELGHAIGLPHSDTFAAIMYRFRHPDDGERYFGAYRKKLRAIDDIGSPAATGLDAEDISVLRQLYK